MKPKISKYVGRQVCQKHKEYYKKGTCCSKCKLELKQSGSSLDSFI